MQPNVFIIITNMTVCQILTCLIDYAGSGHLLSMIKETFDLFYANCINHNHVHKPNPR